MTQETPDIVQKPTIEPDLLESIKANTDVEKQVIVHCCFPCDNMFGSLIRVWPSTFLISTSPAHRSKLIHAENIAISPSWSEVEPFQNFWFTLVFSGLPKGITHFDLCEEISEEGGFYIPNIPRNETDVYRVIIS